jgi:hypothetical protein
LILTLSADHRLDYLSYLNRYCNDRLSANNGTE